MKSVSRCLGTLALVATAALSSTVARAEPQDATPAAPAEAPIAPPVFSQSSAVSYDSVHLRNGGLYRGRVKEILPGDHVTLTVEGGETKEIAWAEIARIVAGTASPQASPEASPPPHASAPPSVGVPSPAARWPDATPPSDPPAPRTQWRANRPLLVTGAILFATGYGSNAVVALPSTGGFVGRVLVLVLTFGLPCIFNSNRDYLCNGQHGAMQLLVPFAGPFLFAGDHPRDTVVNERGTPLSPLAKGLLYTSAGLQFAGVASIIGALAAGRQERVAGPAASETTIKPSFTVAPMSAPGAVGVSLGFYRW